VRAGWTEEQKHKLKDDYERSREGTPMPAACSGLRLPFFFGTAAESVKRATRTCAGGSSASFVSGLGYATNRRRV
jgi:hypothetical protein